MVTTAQAVVYRSDPFDAFLVGHSAARNRQIKVKVTASARVRRGMPCILSFVRSLV